MTGLGGVGCIQLSNVVELQMSHLFPFVFINLFIYGCFPLSFRSICQWLTS